MLGYKRCGTAQSLFAGLLQVCQQCWQNQCRKCSVDRHEYGQTGQENHRHSKSDHTFYKACRKTCEDGKHKYIKVNIGYIILHKSCHITGDIGLHQKCVTKYKNKIDAEAVFLLRCNCKVTRTTPTMQRNSSWHMTDKIGI